MKNIAILLILAAIMMPASEQAVVVMDDAALASYISGRLKQSLADEPSEIMQYCDDTGCAVVVQ